MFLIAGLSVKIKTVHLGQCITYKCEAGVDVKRLDAEEVKEMLFGININDDDNDNDDNNNSNSNDDNDNDDDSHDSDYLESDPSLSLIHI